MLRTALSPLVYLRHLAGWQGMVELAELIAAETR